VYIWIIETNLVDLDIFSSRVLENSGNIVDWWLGRKDIFGYRSTPLFQKGGGCGIAMVRDGVYGARCGSWTYRKGRRYPDV